MPDLRLTEEFTLEAWVRPDSAQADAPVIEKRTSNFYSYKLLAGGETAGVPEGFVADKAFSWEEVAAEEALTSKAWSHLAMTYDGAVIRFYVNGELVDTNSAPGPQTSEGNLLIGGEETEDFFKGRIDEVRIYERALDETELRQTMNAGFPMAITEAATEVEANTAILNGVADANGGATEYFFEYGPTESYGSVVAGEELGSDQEAIEINEAVIDLAPETAYHYRLVTVSPVGTAYGEDRTLTTSERTMTVGEEEEFADAEDKLNLIASESKAGPGSFYGMMWSGNFPKMQKDNIYDAVANSGAKMLRFVVYPGNQTAIDEAFAAAANHDIAVLPYIGHGPFPKPGTKNAEDWIKYGEQMVKKYSPGSGFSHPVKAWEIWNEPNMPFVALSGEQEGKVNPESFASFFKEMSQALRSAAKGEIEVLTPGLYGYRVPGCHPECHLTHALS